jgi:hypothetical protein
MDLRTILLIGHVMGVALGAGGATTSDFLFLTILRNGRIHQTEYRLLSVASGIVITGLMLLTATGIGLIILSGSFTHRFFAKMTIVLIAALNGGLMHAKLFPILRQSAHKQQHFHLNGFAKKLPRISIFGAVSTVSWYSALILGLWRSLTLSYPQILSGYAAILLLAMLGAIASTHWLMRQNAPNLRRTPKRDRRRTVTSASSGQAVSHKNQPATSR